MEAVVVVVEDVVGLGVVIGTLTEVVSTFSVTRMGLRLLLFSLVCRTSLS